MGLEVSHWWTSIWFGRGVSFVLGVITSLLGNWIWHRWKRWQRHRAGSYFSLTSQKNIMEFEGATKTTVKPEEIITQLFSQKDQAK